MKRFFRKLRADLGGDFWLPCPVCGEMFGGFEIGSGHVTLPDGSKKCCCKNCDFEAGQIEAMNRNIVFLSPKAARLVRT